MKVLQRFWPIVAIIVLWFIFASPYFLKGLIPFPSKYLTTFFPPWNAVYGMPVKNNAMPDVITQLYPWKTLTIDTWKKGEIPLWNPYSFAGTVQAGNYQSAVFSPFNLLFFMLPFVDAWSILILLQPLLAGLGMYFYLKSLERSKEGSLLGSVAFMFCGFLVVWMAYGTLGYAVLWLPWILCAINRELARHSWWNLMGVTVGIALSLFSGHFQMSLYVLLFTALYLSVEFVTSKQFRSVGSLFLFFVLGIFTASPQLLPAVDAYIKSVRSTTFAIGEIIPWRYLVTIVVPDFYGNPVTRNDWFGHYAEWASFMGVVPFFFALMTIFGKKNRHVVFLWTTAIGSILLSAFTPLVVLVAHLQIPVLSGSAASRVIVIASFSLSALAGFGIDYVTLAWKKGDRRIKLFALSAVAVVLVIVWTMIFLRIGLPLDKVSIAKHNAMLSTGIAFAFVFLLFFGSHVHRVRWLILLVFIGITMFDTLRYASKWMPFDPKEFVYPDMPIITFLKDRVGLDRIYGNLGGEFFVRFQIPSVEGYDAVYPRRYGELAQSASNGTVSQPGRSVVLIDKHGIHTDEFFQLLGIKYIVHRISDGRNSWAYPVWEYPVGQYKSIYKDEQYEVFENTKVLPRAFLASSYVVASGQAIVDSLFSSEMDRRETVVLEQKPALAPMKGEGSVHIFFYTPMAVKMDVVTTVPKLLFLSDSYDEGWKAWVDEKPPPLYRADYAFRAISVPAGVHVVRFSYKPKTARVGFFLASLVLGILIIGTIKERSRRI